MRTGRVLDFRNYFQINEDDAASKPSPAENAVDQIVNNFFMGYTLAIGIMDEYKGVKSDFDKIMNADGKDKGNAMKDILISLAKEAKKYGNEVVTGITDMGQDISDAFELAIGTDEGKKSLVKIDKSIYTKVSDYQQKLIDQYKNSPKLEVAKDNNSYQMEEQGHLFEKNLFVDERDSLISQINPKKAQVDDMIKHAAPEFKSRYQEISNKYQSDLDNLHKDEFWSGMKRRGRKDELEKIAGNINQNVEDYNTISSDIVKKLGIDTQVTDKLKDFSNNLLKVSDLIQKAKDLEAKNKSEEDKKTDEKKADEAKANAEKNTFVEIKSGTVDKANIAKGNANSDKIKEAQTIMNTMLSKENQIVADGQYGKKTESAIRTISTIFKPVLPDLFQNIDGKSLTPEFRKFLDTMNKPETKDKLKTIFPSTQK